MVLIWLISGIAAVAAAYFLTGSSLDPWSGLHAAEVVAGLYFLALVVYLTRPPFPRKARVFAVVVAVVFVASAGFISYTFENTTRWQQSQLMKVLGVIQRGIIASEMPDPLLTTLDRYYRQRPVGKKTIGQTFREVVPGAEVGKEVARPGDPSNRLVVYLAALSDEEVVLVGQPSWGKGYDPEFENFNGTKGLPQVRAAVTKKGVSYESEN